LVALSGCGEQPIYSATDSVSESWTYDQPLSYTFDIEDNSTFYDLLFDLEYSTEFGYQNLYVKIVTEFPNGKSSKDIVSLNLTDGAGTFLGNCSSSSCEVEILLQEKFKFESVGKHTISVFQNSREPQLDGVKGATMKLFQRNNKK